jgi:16S rRNA (cytidine1402-2'-O)-methyltransferase
MAGKLYIVATPIGNLEDITLRAIKKLKEVDLILAEDTRQTRVLLKHYEIDVHTMSYFQHSGEKRRLEILNHLLDGKNVALVTDAGTPGISDPGNELIDFLLSYVHDLEIIPIPGASAITTALSVSGFNVNKFVFLGFLPKKKRKKLFDWLKNGKVTFAFYESPKRLLKTLETLEKVFGGYRRIFIARELTKIHETLYRGKIKDVRRELEEKKGEIKGEIVVVIEM